MPDLKKLITLEALEAALPSWLKSLTKPSYTQDEVGDGTTYKRVSSTEKATWNAKGTYSKPSSGIPKSDLASAVQTSLGKADTALQSFTETDPTVPSWAKAENKPSYTASEVGAIATTAKGANGGVAELDSNGKVPSSQLPSDVYNHATDSSRLTTATASGLYKVASTNQGHIASLTAVTKSDITGLGIPASDTNTYVSGASFADNTSSDANNPLKLTLARSGSVTTSVKGTLPKVSSSTAGVVPKGASVSSQSQSTKFLRQDGTWAVPSYTANAYNATTIEPCNFNTLTTAGLYLVNQTGSSNLPWTRGEWILLQVFRPTPDNAQHVIQIGRSLNFAGEFCVRHRYLNTWSSWYSFSGTVIS